MQLSSPAAVRVVEQLWVQGRSQQAGALNATHFNPAVDFGELTQYRFKGGSLVLCLVQAAEDLGFQDQKGTRPLREVVASPPHRTLQLVAAPLCSHPAPEPGSSFYHCASPFGSSSQGCLSPLALPAAAFRGTLLFPVLFPLCKWKCCSIYTGRGHEC